MRAQKHQGLYIKRIRISNVEMNRMLLSPISKAVNVNKEIKIMKELALNAKNEITVTYS